MPWYHLCMRAHLINSRRYRVSPATCHCYLRQKVWNVFPFILRCMPDGMPKVKPRWVINLVSWRQAFLTFSTATKGPFEDSLIICTAAGSSLYDHRMNFQVNTMLVANLFLFQPPQGDVGSLESSCSSDCPPLGSSYCPPLTMRNPLSSKPGAGIWYCLNGNEIFPCFYELVWLGERLCMIDEHLLTYIRR